MTTYVEQPDSGNVLGMVLLVIAVLAIVGFGIWFFSGYNQPSTIIRDTTTETNTVTPIPTPTAPPSGGFSAPSNIDTNTAPAPSPAPAGTGTGGTTP
jgi:hypothetical protein